MRFNDQCDALAREGEDEFFCVISGDTRFGKITPMSGETFSHYDFDLMTTGGTEYKVEVKKRTFGSTDRLAKEGVFLAMEKVGNLLPYAWAGHQIRYVNVFADGTIYMWNLNKWHINQPQIEWIPMNYKTGKNWQSYNVVKPVFRLNLADAIRLK